MSSQRIHRERRALPSCKISGALKLSFTHWQQYGIYEWDDDELTPGRKKEGGWSQNLFDPDGHLVALSLATDKPKLLLHTFASHGSNMKQAIFRSNGFMSPLEWLFFAQVLLDELRWGHDFGALSWSSTRQLYLTKAIDCQENLRRMTAAQTPSGTFRSNRD